jgi:hypothetical protein
VSHDETRRNCDEFGPNLTAEIPSSGPFFSWNSLLLSDIFLAGELGAILNLL